MFEIDKKLKKKLPLKLKGGTVIQITEGVVLTFLIMEVVYK